MMQASAEEQNIIDELSAIYDGRAHGQYGLTRVNQRTHAVQSGYHARAQGLPPSQIVAALLHDIGHMIHDLGDHPAASGVDDYHETLGAAWLAERFGPAVSEPIRLHVAAKRFLCTVEVDYRSRLSGDSIESLALQGGDMSAEELAAFEAETFQREAVTLRRIDELAKDPHGPMPAFSEFHQDILKTLREQQYSNFGGFA
jgi:[1-hydroxy-2-(trimethylamino)ethyl]phosphonate dioxygenase